MGQAKTVCGPKKKKNVSRARLNENVERSCSWILADNFPGLWRHKQMITNDIVSIKGDKAEKAVLHLRILERDTKKGLNSSFLCSLMQMQTNFS